MSMRIFSSLALAIALASCGSGKDAGSANSLAEAEAISRSDAANSGLIDCAVSGRTAFERTCTVEREQTDAGLVLVIRHEDGGFRRFRVLTDGRGVIVADGAEPAIVRPLGAKAISVQVGTDQYHLPATVKSSGPDSKP